MLGLPILALLIELPAKKLHLLIKLMLVQNAVETIVENVARRLDHILDCDPELLLPLLLPRSHCHAD
jgi:hypothetical protein